MWIGLGSGVTTCRSLCHLGGFHLVAFGADVGRTGVEPQMVTFGVSVQVPATLR